MRYLFPFILGIFTFALSAKEVSVTFDNPADFYEKYRFSEGIEDAKESSEDRS